MGQGIHGSEDCTPMGVTALVSFDPLSFIFLAQEKADNNYKIK
jgi:hypothetical protein